MILRLYFSSRAGVAVAAYLLAALAIPVLPAHADELDNLHQQILRNPGNSSLNIRFAQLAESSGKLRWALAAYERAVLNDPNNPDVLQGLTRVRRALQPDTTLLTVQLGSQYESNPRYYLPPRTPEMQGFASAALLDERNLNGTRWRTNGLAAGLFHARESDLNYGVAGLETGPVLDAAPGWSFHPAAGGNVTAFDHRFYYGEGTVSGMFESATQGIYRSLTVRGAYRSYNDFFPSGEGFWGEVRGKVAVPNVVGTGSALIVSPWVLWSRISGGVSVVSPIVTELQVGAYTEFGGRADLLKSITDWMVLGLNVTVIQRDYLKDIVVATGAKRHDTIMSPGAALTFPKALPNQADLRFEYRFLNDHSNDQTKRFNDHIVSVSVVARFDPTLPPPWATPAP